MTHLLGWDRQESENYEPGWHVGSEGENGEHLRDSEDGWPHSIYRRSRSIGQCDLVLCHGIQSIEEAHIIARLLNERH